MVITAKIVKTIKSQKHQIDKKVLRQDRVFSTRLNYALKKIREIWMNWVNTTYNSTEDMTDKIQELKGKTKIKFCKNKSNYYDIMNNRMEEDPFSKNAQSINKIYREAILLMKFLQNKTQVRNMINV